MSFRSGSNTLSFGKVLGQVVTRLLLVAYLNEVIHADPLAAADNTPRAYCKVFSFCVATTEHDDTGVC